MSRSSWLLPLASIVVAVPAQATQYLSVEQAQRLCFPAASEFVEAHIVFTPADVAAIERASGQKVRTRGEQVWRAQAGGRLLGFFIVDYVIGKHEVIDYAVALDASGKVGRIEILQYRESYGGEIANRDWLAQFAGKGGGASLAPGRDITIISGATLSSRHVTEGVKRVLAIHDLLLR
ncbi:MAG: FMN-binding protein [Reyranella sp.]|uniref:FMN-binding protein n=1 Tax=Reyranella sp. TaxID=1929291 RepID=UPI001AD15423|nr:FMN-binding protein [Reyranella sp.]MBN9086350.1 FMN-binding protein [Reyranella sp.]